VQVCPRTLAAHDANSHVMQYGDLNMNKDCLLTYFGAHHANCINDNNTYSISIKFAHLISLVLLVITTSKNTRVDARVPVGVDDFYNEYNLRIL
jgi:hypothetical protein